MPGHARYQALEKRVGRMLMLDYSLANLHMASSMLATTALVRGTVDKLPFEGGVFDFVALIRSESEKWAPVIKKTGARID